MFLLPFFFYKYSHFNLDHVIACNINSSVSSHSSFLLSVGYIGYAYLTCTMYVHNFNSTTRSPSYRHSSYVMTSILMSYLMLSDIKNPDRGVAVKMSNIDTKVKCSLSVSVICTTDGIQVCFVP